MARIKHFYILLMIVPIFSFGQGRIYEGPEDPAADISEVRIGYLNGNRVLMPFKNTTTLGASAQSLFSKWPNNYEGTQMTDNITVMIGSEVYVYNDSIPITDLSEVASLSQTGKVDTLYFMQGNDPGRNDHNYYHTIDWAIYPVAGYSNTAQDYLAQSNKPDSWPVEGWPSSGFDKKWVGEWNGRFGRGIKYADLETYFVSNDAQDLENIVERNDPEEKLITNGPRYYPRPGKYIGDINPNVTVQKGYPWGGLGLRIALRNFQWNNPEAQDMIFMEYEVSNISDYDLPVSGFGLFVDGAVGGEHSPDGDIGFFDKSTDMAYAWDYDGVGLGGLEPGTIGLAFLESPGRAYDGIDTDEDGLVDEKRDNPAGTLIGPTDGIQNLDKFLSYYNLKEEELHDHFEGDEDQDWIDGFDANGNGKYAYQDNLGIWKLEPGEQPGDDVGLDGVGPLDINYNGPDEGECNHMPDFKEGIGCEPNFAATDVSESDMIGLSSFSVFDWYKWTGNNWQLNNDKNVWDLMKSHNFRELESNLNSVYFQFGSSTFPFYKGRTERISMAMLFAYENLADLNSSEHNANNLVRLKKTAQIIYERDYRFAQPPLMPTLTATAEDGKVILTWNDVADKLTREPFLDRINDFEGYKVYRSTDNLMSDPEVITDGKGVTKFKKPIYQCDLIDSLEGYTDFGLVGGTAFYLGDETGITHYFIDDQVQNGRTYYYALVAYDFGAESIGAGISPTENNVVIELDESENVVQIGTNVAIATPHQKSAGYKEPDIVLENSDAFGTGKLGISIIDRNAISPDHTYKIIFKVDTLGSIRKNSVLRHPLDNVIVNNGIYVYDVTNENRLVYEENIGSFPLENILTDGVTKVGDGFTYANYNYYRNDKPIKTDIFEGIQIELNNMAILGEIDEEESGWIVGESRINIMQSKYDSHSFPYTYDIIFTDNNDAHTPKITRSSYIYNLDGETGEYVGNTYIQTIFLFGRSFSFYVVDRSHPDESGNYLPLEIVVQDLNKDGKVDMLEDRFLVGNYFSPGNGNTYWAGTIFGFDFLDIQSEEDLPNPGDIYRVDFHRPFFDSDSILFSVTKPVPAQVEDLNNTMEKIKVVPNPYIMTNSMEPAVANKFLNQRRRLLFTQDRKSVV